MTHESQRQVPPAWSHTPDDAVLESVEGTLTAIYPGDWPSRAELIERVAREVCEPRRDGGRGLPSSYNERVQQIVPVLAALRVSEPRYFK